MKDLNFKQKILLTLLRVLDKKPMSPIQIMKALFLYSQEEKPQNFYIFKPYLYGPCSFEVYSDINKLFSNGLIVESPSYYSWNFYSISSKGEDCLQRSVKKEEIEKIKETVISKSFIGLLKYVYSKYPEYTNNSIINKEILKEL